MRCKECNLPAKYISEKSEKFKVVEGMWTVKAYIECPNGHSHGQSLGVIVNTELEQAVERHPANQ